MAEAKEEAETPRDKIKQAMIWRSYPFIENDYYYDMLLSFGQACECLAPTHIREELKRRAQAIAAMYE